MATTTGTAATGAPTLLSPFPLHSLSLSSRQGVARAQNPPELDTILLFLPPSLSLFSRFFSVD